MKAGALPGWWSRCSQLLVVAPLARSAFLLPTKPRPHNPSVTPMPSFPLTMTPSLEKLMHVTVREVCQEMCSHHHLFSNHLLVPASCSNPPPSKTSGALKAPAPNRAAEEAAGSAATSYQVDGNTPRPCLSCPFFWGAVSPQLPALGLGVCSPQGPWLLCSISSSESVTLRILSYRLGGEFLSSVLGEGPGTEWRWAARRASPQVVCQAQRMTKSIHPTMFGEQGAHLASISVAFSYHKDPADVFWTFLNPLVPTGQPQGAEDPHPGDESGKTFFSDMVTWMTTCSTSSKDMSRKE